MLTGAGPAYVTPLVDRVAEAEGVTAVVFGQAVCLGCVGDGRVLVEVVQSGADGMGVRGCSRLGRALTGAPP